jgi:hypothetical protein
MKNLKILFFSLFISSIVFSQNEMSPEDRAVIKTERYAKELKLKIAGRSQKKYVLV